MHIHWVPSFFSTNSTSAPQGDELGHINSLACSLAICFLSSTNSFMGIIYGLLEIGGVLGNNSITNSMSWSGGIPSNSSGNTSGYSWTTLISSKAIAFVWLSILPWSDCAMATNSTVVSSFLVNLTAFWVHWITLSYLLNQSTPHMMSIPFESKRMRFDGMSIPL
jgi:hypothetical protein